MTTPNPDTERSAVRADPLGDIRAELQALRNHVRVVSMRPDPPPKSRLERATEHRWTPAAVAALIAALSPVLSVWLARDDEATRELEARAKAQQEATAELTRRIGELRDEVLAAEQARERRERAYGHGFCALGVRHPSWECDSVELLPPPHPRSKAAPIQLRE